MHGVVLQGVSKRHSFVCRLAQGSIHPKREVDILVQQRVALNEAM